MIRVRVRGVAATALSKIMLEKGYVLVQASNVIRKRFNLEANNQPADVTVKDAGEDELLVLGFQEQARRVYDDLVDALQYVFKWISPIGLYSIHVGIVRERVGDNCIVELGEGVEGLLPKCRNNSGDRVAVCVEKAPVKPGEMARLSYRLRVVGEYVSLIHGSPSLSVSEHIRDREKREYLLAIATAKLMGSGLGVHFRSSSMYGGREDIEREIDVLREKLLEIVEKTRSIDDPPRMIYEGEFIGLIGLTSLAKKALDEHRGEVVSTIPRHHSFKTCGGLLSEIVDFVEQYIGVDESSREAVARAMDKYLLEKLASSPRIRVVHKTPDGRVSELTPGYLYDVREISGGYEIVFTRTMRSDGVYNGLDVEKKAGDIDYMLVRSGEWMISHNYYRGDKWIGSYININTPPEILPGLIKYHDLAVDINVKPGEKPEIIDYEEFEEYCEKEIISNKLCRETEEKIKEIAENVEKHLYKPPK